MFLWLGACFGGLAVALGAYAQHVWYADLSSEHYAAVQTALHYLLLHGVLLSGLAFVQLSRWRLYFTCIQFAFALGTLCFSGGIIAKVVMHCTAAAVFAPFGGGMLIVAWVSLAIAGMLGLSSIQARRDNIGC